MNKYIPSDYDQDEFIKVFDELPLWSAPFGLKLLDFIRYKKGITALDIGFGSGFPLIEIAMRLGNSSIVYGIDPWKQANDRTMHKINFYEIKNIHLIEGVAESIPLEDRSVDLIVSNNGINNVQDMEQVFSECQRIIKPGGQFLMTMNLDKSMFEFYSLLENILLEKTMINEIEEMRQHIYERRRPLAEMIQLFNKHDFIIRDLVHDQFNYKFADGTALFEHSFIRKAFMRSWNKILPPDQVEEVLGSVESRFNDQAKITGEIQLSIPFVLINSIKS